MQVLIIAMLLAATLTDYIVRNFGLPRQLLLTPEALSAIALIIVTVRLPRNRFADVEPRYLAIFALLFLHLAASIVVNHVPPGAIVSAARIYLKAIPFFFLPLLVPMTEKNLKWQLLVLAAVCLMQFPIAFSQRSASMFKGSLTGDRTVGTLGISSIMTVFLCFAAAVAMSLYLKGKLKLQWLVLFLACALPATMINETKATLFLAPLALLVPTFFAGGGNAVKRNVIVLLLVSGFLCAFLPTYDYYVKQRWGYGLIDFFMMDGRVEGYLMKDSDLGSSRGGRIDALRLPFLATGHDVMQSAFGFGPGNVSKSSLGPQFTGAQYPRYGDLVGTSAGFLLWEVGVVGFLLVLTMLYLIFRDALVARKADGFAGSIGLAWVCVSGLMGLGLFYNRPIESNPMSYVFFYFSGVVAATAMRVRAEVGSTRVPRALQERRLRPRTQGAFSLAGDTLRASRKR